MALLHRKTEYDLVADSGGPAALDTAQMLW
jgi:hypothetical protein